MTENKANDLGFHPARHSPMFWKAMSLHKVKSVPEGSVLPNKLGCLLELNERKRGDARLQAVQQERYVRVRREIHFFLTCAFLFNGVPIPRH